MKAIIAVWSGNHFTKPNREDFTVTFTFDNSLLLSKVYERPNFALKYAHGKEQPETEKGRCKVLFESDTYASSSLSLDIKNCASQSEATIATSS